MCITICVYTYICLYIHIVGRRLLHALGVLQGPRGRQPEVLFACHVISLSVIYIYIYMYIYIYYIYEPFPDHPNPEPQTVLYILLCSETRRTVFLNVLFKCFQVPVPVVW